MNKISIIVPVYNVEKYLARCVNSLVSQSYRELEIILVDDGATDKSGIIADELAGRDSRIVVIHKENGGLSDARNAGIEKATGDYICFVDSDDYVSDDYCMKMLEISEKENADIVICNYLRFSGDEYTGETKNSDSLKQYDKVAALEMIYSPDGEKFTVAWNKLYRRNVIADIRYPKGKVNEDEYTTYKYFLNAEKIVTTDTVLYYYFMNNNSITTNRNYLSNTDILGALKERKAIISKTLGSEKLLRLTDKNYLDRIIYRNRFLRSVDKKKSRDFVNIYRDYFRKTDGPVDGIGYRIYYVSPGIYYLLLQLTTKLKRK